ncbi:MAG: dihydroorotase [Clostridium sp.]|jgi:dihydroorotase|nr:dihydroorotase [Clostridium sp.]
MLLIEKGYLIDPKSGKEGHYDILTQGSRILRISPGLRGALPRERLRGCRILNAEGLLVAPGLVDAHVHFREPGFPEKEDIRTGAAAAARGGFTTVVMMANTRPAVDEPQILRGVLGKGKETAIHVEACAAVTKGLEGKVLTAMEALAEAGAAGFSDDGHPLLREPVVRAAMEKAAALDKVLSFHEEDPALIGENGIHRGRASAHFGLSGSPREAETVMIERDLRLAAETGACVNIQHISTKEGVELVRLAKRRGQHVHAEATPHHFSMTQEDTIRYGAMAKMNPPLREEADRQAVIGGLADGTVDLIATDHAPHTRAEKALPIDRAPSGIIGLETALSLGITKLVHGGYLTMRQLLAKMSVNPAAMYQLDAGYLAEGGPADLVLIDTAASWVVEDFFSKSANSPFIGQTLKGEVSVTICDGKIAYRKPGWKGGKGGGDL